jgi:hypothetical protein
MSVGRGCGHDDAPVFGPTLIEAFSYRHPRPTDMPGIRLTASLACSVKLTLFYILYNHH